jgi:hypothetical protein
MKEKLILAVTAIMAFSVIGLVKHLSPKDKVEPYIKLECSQLLGTAEEECAISNYVHRPKLQTNETN